MPSVRRLDANAPLLRTCSYFGIDTFTAGSALFGSSFILGVFSENQYGRFSIMAKWKSCRKISKMSVKGHRNQRTEWSWGMPIFADSHRKSVTIATSIARSRKPKTRI